jgi:putative GTP pyrophosphokinase
VHAISKTKIDEAGEILRAWADGVGQEELDEEPQSSAVDLLFEYRVSFSAPLTAVESELAPIVADVAPDAELAGRPKRAAAILAKLMRFPSMRLTQMDDIAGLRVKFPNGPREVQLLLGRILERWPGAAVKDYVARPKRTGYRAIHAFVPADEHIVEVQLRTACQNLWADEVESAADRLGFRLKDGEGPEALVRYFERAAYKLAIEEQGGTVDEAFQRDFEDLRREVRPYFADRRP